VRKCSLNAINALEKKECPKSGSRRKEKDHASEYRKKY